MIVKGRVMPRPIVEIAVVDSNQRPGGGSSFQKPRSVNRCGAGSGVSWLRSWRLSVVSDTGQPCHEGPTTGDLSGGYFADAGRRGRRRARHPQPGSAWGARAVSLVVGARPGAEPAHATKRWTVPTGKVKFFDSEKGFGFVSGDAGEGDVFVPASALPEGVAGLKGGQRIEFSIAEGRRGAQALSVRLLDPAPSVATNRRVASRKPAEEMVVIVEDVIKLLDSLSESLRRGHYPDKEHGNKVAQVLHAVAGDLEL